MLDGIFQDEAGSYFRNPRGTFPLRDGCTLFVRLWQFREGDVKRAGDVRLSCGQVPLRQPFYSKMPVRRSASRNG